MWYNITMSIKSQVLQQHYRTINAGGISDGTLNEESWRNLLEQNDYKCAICREPKSPLCIDHIVAVSRGGPNSLSNVQPLCRKCNSRKVGTDKGRRNVPRIQVGVLLYADEKSWFYCYCERQGFSISEGASRAINALMHNENKGIK
jgi:hypothetical protein